MSGGSRRRIAAFGALHGETADILQAMRPLDPADLVRGQFREKSAAGKSGPCSWTIRTEA